MAQCQHGTGANEDDDDELSDTPAIGVGEQEAHVIETLAAAESSIVGIPTLRNIASCGGVLEA